jgi:hypothetical protein
MLPAVVKSSTMHKKSRVASFRSPAFEFSLLQVSDVRRGLLHRDQELNGANPLLGVCRT